MKTPEETIAELEERLRSEASAFCKAHAEATARATEARKTLALAVKYAGEANVILMSLLTNTNEKQMPIDQRRALIRATERIRRIEKSGS